MCPFMKQDSIRLLAARLNLSAESVSVWFIRKRARLREKFWEGNCSLKVTILFLKFCYCVWLHLTVKNKIHVSSWKSICTL